MFDWGTWSPTTRSDGLLLLTPRELEIRVKGDQLLNYENSWKLYQTFKHFFPHIYLEDKMPLEGKEMLRLMFIFPTRWNNKLKEEGRIKVAGKWKIHVTNTKEARQDHKEVKGNMAGYKRHDSYGKNKG